ncbi:MAG: hypothetical protein R3D26_20645 [Cyanobacteriota/Melainabacteria group bacterium]
MSQPGATALHHAQLAASATETYSIRHVLFKLCGAIAYLKSLVPPITLDRFSI